MKKQMTTILLILVFFVLDIFGIIFGNLILNNNFVITDGEYTYNDLFYSADNNKDYYRFKKMYYEGNECDIFNDDIFRNVSFRTVDKIKSVTLLSFVTKKSFLGYYSLSDEYMNEQELSEVYAKTDFVNSSISLCLLRTLFMKKITVTQTKMIFIQQQKITEALLLCLNWKV